MISTNTKKAVNLLHLAWLLRADLRQGEPAGNDISDWFRQWWAMEGYREYPASAMPNSERQYLLSLLPDWPRYGRFGMTSALYYLLERRADLQKTFDVSTETGLWHAVAWFFTHGLKEYGLLNVVDATTLAALDETPPFLRLSHDAVNDLPPLTWLMFFVWRCATDLQAAFDLRTSRGQETYLYWFLLEGVHHLHLTKLVAPRWRDWLQESLALKTQPTVGVPRAALLLWQQRKDMQQTFDLRQPESWVSLARWSQAALQVEPTFRWMAEQSRPMLPLTQNTSVSCKLRPLGLNLIGFAFGELGIGEDVRMAVAACEAAGIAFKVVNIHPGDHLRQADRTLDGHVTQSVQDSEEAPYAINLFCLTGFDTVRVFLERGAALFDGRYNIGWWPWELPVWPKDWQIAFDFVNEVWAASEFTREMYTRAQQQSVVRVPVTLMPLPASVERLQAITRRQLGLQEKRFLFLYVFDFNSYLTRKNPFAALTSFHRAFAADDDSVGLVLKTMNSQPDHPIWKRFVRACATDVRIVLLDKTLDRGEVLGLIKACDAYVSLHRSEGFGRTLAEAMLLGKPVVGTDFSGSVDFLTNETGFPVQWKRQVVKPGEYPFVTEQDGAWWAQADMADAARQLRAAYSSSQAQRGRSSFAARVKRIAKEQFSPQRIGKLMRERIETIYDNPRFLS